jgi:DNA-binding transcriptional LysR family regulator
MKLNLLDYRILVLFCTAKSKSKTLHILDISDSSLRRGIKKLEYNFGRNLFSYSGDSVIVSDKALELSKYFSDSVELLSNPTFGLESDKNPFIDNSELLVVMPAAFQEALVETLFNAINTNKNSPRIHVVDWIDDIETQLMQCALSIGVGYYPQRFCNEIVQRKISENQLCIYMDNSDPLAQLDKIELIELKGREFISLGNPFDHFDGRGGDIRQEINSLIDFKLINAPLLSALQLIKHKYLLFGTKHSQHLMPKNVIVKEVTLSGCPVNIDIGFYYHRKWVDNPHFKELEKAIKSTTELYRTL